MLFFAFGTSIGCFEALKPLNGPTLELYASPLLTQVGNPGTGRTLRSHSGGDFPKYTLELLEVLHGVSVEVSFGFAVDIETSELLT